MRLYSKEERDNAGFALELILRTLLSFPADNPDAQPAQNEALRCLQKAQELLKESGFYSEEFDPSLAAY
jgi:hypothetical protein